MICFPGLADGAIETGFFSPGNNNAGVVTVSIAAGEKVLSPRRLIGQR